MKDKKNIILIGMPGVGKSTVGVILAKMSGCRFIDADLLIQEREGKLLKDIIREKGTDGFIEIENQVNASIEAEKSVIATGGSVIYGKEAMQHLKEIGTVVYLKVSFGIISKRLRNIKGRGVVLKEGQTLRGLYEERTKLYEKYADIVVSTERLNVEQTIEKVRRTLQSAGAFPCRSYHSGNHFGKNSNGRKKYSGRRHHNAGKKNQRIEKAGYEKDTGR